MMDKLTKARVLLNALVSNETTLGNTSFDTFTGLSPLRIPYAKFIADRNKLIDKVYETFSSSDQEFLASILYDSSEKPSYDGAVSFLTNYIESQHPYFMDDLLLNAEQLRDDGQLICAALMVRLFCETAMKNRFPQFCEGRHTLGDMVYDMKTAFGNSFDPVNKRVHRLNSITHNDTNHQDHPCTSDEITSLIEWSRSFESMVSRLPDPQ